MLLSWLRLPEVKSFRSSKNGIIVFAVLTRYLAENDVITFGSGQDESRTSFGSAQVGKGEWNDYNIPLYKSCHASSSSGFSQSFAKDDSLIMAISSISRPDFAFKK